MKKEKKPLASKADTFISAKKSEQSEDKQYSIKQNIKRFYLETVKKINGSLKKHEEKTVFSYFKSILTIFPTNVKNFLPFYCFAGIFRCGALCSQAEFQNKRAKPIVHWFKTYLLPG